MLLEISNASVSRGGHTVLEDFSFSIRGTEKIAVVGKNGAGKSTLLEVLDGSCRPDTRDGHPEAEVHVSRAVTIGRFSQTAAPEDAEKTPEVFVREAAIMQAIPEQSAYYASFVSDFYKHFTRLGFQMEDREKKLSAFSGGEQAKILLLRLFATRPDILLLDEPTNHLDLETVEWLEDEVRAYPKAVVMVSHDRYFIDRTADVVWEVSGGKLTRYVGNYTAYRTEKQKRHERQLRQYEAQQAEIQRLEELISRFRNKPRKAAFARSRAKMLERMERMPKPREDEARIHTEEIIPAVRGSKNVLDCDGLVIGYEKNHPVRRLSFRLKRGQKIGIFGPNGAGKSAYLKTLAGLLPKLDGKFSVSETAQIGYFDQKSAELTSDERVFDYFHDRYPALTGAQVRKTLAGYLFREKDFGKRVSELSGGEKARLVLAVLLEERPNLLLLDEPTNNMDIPAKETLESIFRQYQGTLVFISHDRYFLSHVAQELLFFPPDSQEVLYYPFGYEHYRGRQSSEAGADAAALRSAKEQRMIEELRAVPKGTSMRPRELSTASLQLDWELGVNQHARERAEEAYARAAAEYQEALEAAENRQMSPETYLEGMPEETAQSLEVLKSRMEKARDEWTKELVQWQDIMEDSGLAGQTGQEEPDNDRNDRKEETGIAGQNSQNRG